MSRGRAADEPGFRTATGASKATVSRALTAFEDRDWVDRTGSRAALTPLGDVVAEAVASLTATLGTAADLRGVVDHLPLDDLGFDLGRLSGATVVTPRGRIRWRRSDTPTASSSAPRRYGSSRTPSRRA
ncbi:hypothetical protein ACFQRB_19980 [Halobaculum litoreum]|uniref:HVO-A0261-like N-terminal domain-containing protein n=1 Tax=Halobaculum litoreum TaxID=3031998 RepID=A0ABD5XSM2_9EURY